MNITQSIRRLAAVCVTLASFSALHAASYNFNFSGNGTVTTSKTFNSTPGGLSVNVTANAWDGNSFEGAKVGQYSGGLGVTNSGNDGNHTVDSSGWTDYLMFGFSQSLDVNSISIGYVDSGFDSQFTYWLVNSNAWSAGLGNLASGALSGSTSGNTGTYNINAGNTFAQYLIIAANGSDVGPNDAGFKVKSLNVTTRNNVPDGGSVVAMVGASLLALVAFRRRFVR